MMTDQTKVRPVLALTMGDPAGIGPELCLRALAAAEVSAACIPVLFGDATVLRRVAAACSLSFAAPVVAWSAWQATPIAEEPTIVDCAALDGAVVQPGLVVAECGRAAYVYIERAIQVALQQQVAGVVTAPIHKEALHLAGVPFPGHTEIFAAHTDASRACMMLAADELTVSFVTTHIGLCDVPAAITTDRILDVIELTSAALRCIHGRRSHIAVCGLNPHAGEHGLFGRAEEERLIAPAVAAARKAGYSVEGPLPPDAAFVSAKRATVDAYVCMYHDQGHIPFKMLAFETGVNTTLGLPIVRTSVDHGTAFDIAWRGEASPTSLYQAIFMAAKLAAPVPAEDEAAP